MTRSRFAILGVLAVVSASAHASLMRVDYDLYTAAVPSHWTSSDPFPDSIHASFTVDTGSVGSSNFRLDTAPDGSSCVSQFMIQGISISDVSVTSGSLKLGSGASSANGRFGGANPGDRCPNGFFGSFGFSTDDLLFGGSTDFLGMMAADFTASSDPFADLLRKAVSAPLSVSVRGGWGSVVADGTGRVTEVPEPATLALFGAALLGLALRRKFAAYQGR